MGREPYIRLSSGRFCSPLRRWILWRAATEIVVQPMIGRGSHFASVADALENLIPARS